MRIFPVFNKIFTANILYWECRRRKGALTPPPCTGLSLLGGWGESPLHHPKIAYPLHLEKPLQPNFYSPPPTKQQFSSYNPIKTAFLAVFIVPAPFLF